ncbi:STAS/SEC14 domain-containing protein [Aliiglaciecola sp. CAU 1673]|uniref:STAS/SEC14 domain-containing protein n=1 Tax=Aliiglaciecola sp. CAU 1673 TaxID=3032595 RepID=UPI0023DACF43|nr:STAS/SEC14 domain-containing protein [Aliiglaciecola sp. CAU 1673]MDF2178388.1 STAS/SEC14 domain-containing protein [Aliiglaciecola sp. CAU 1673]
MSHYRHGLSVGIERIGNQFFLNLKAVGKLTHEDYKTITPMLDSALAGVKAPNVRSFFDATEFQGWELRAAWDDFKLGLKHGNEFERIAILGNKGWQEWAAKVGSWFISGEVKYFEDYQAAIAWLQE